jgi:hypothetical protein
MSVSEKIYFLTKREHNEKYRQVIEMVDALKIRGCFADGAAGQVEENVMALVYETIKMR